MSSVLVQMTRLGKAMHDINICRKEYGSNTFYQTYCQAQLMDLLWELKLFKLFNLNKKVFQNLL